MENISEKEFDEKVKNGVVLVDFFANWCGPCRMMSPILEDAQKELGEDVKIYKVDVDNDTALAKKYGIMSIPTLILFVDGQETEKHIGLWDFDELVQTVSSYKK